MARTFTPQDGYAIMNVLTRTATGQTAIAITDISSYISAGETVLSTGKENVYNALGILVGRTLIASRIYKEKLQLMNAIDTGSYTNRIRKISYYADDALPSGFFNTDLFTNLANGYTSGDNGGVSTKSQWEQHQKMPLEMNFAGSTVWQHAITLYEEQINVAFRDPVEMAQFVAGLVQEHENDIKSTRESFNRMTLLSKIAACYSYTSGNLAKNAINLTSEYNAWFGTSYTTAQLKTTYLDSFLKFMTAKIKETSDFFEERSATYHLPMTKTVGGVNYNILRHTDKDRQRLYLFHPLIRKAEAMVLPEIFNPEYLSIGNYEGVEFWQSNESDDDRSKVKIKTAVYDSVTGEQTATANVELDDVVGVLADVDCMMTDMQLERSLSTGLEARKGYRNVWLSFAMNAINDPTENCVIFYMAD